MNRAGEGGDDHPSFRLSDMPVQVGEHGTFRRAVTRHLRIRGITEQTEHALIPVMGKTSQVEVLTIHRGVIKLEITRENHSAHWGRDRQRKAVGH